jgi:hypothetical protein
MSIGSFREKLAAHKAQGGSLTLVHGDEASTETRSTSEKLSKSLRLGLWILTLVDMSAVPWMLSLGDWFDQTSGLTGVLTLGSHHQLVLIMAIVGFVMLGAVALKTDGFTATERLDRMVIILACLVSAIALAGAITVILPLAALIVLLSLRGWRRRPKR